MSDLAHSTFQLRASPNPPSLNYNDLFVKHGKISMHGSRSTLAYNRCERHRGSQQFVESAMLGKGFLVNDTLSVSILALSNSKASAKLAVAGSKRAFALVDQAEANT